MVGGRLAQHEACQAVGVCKSGASRPAAEVGCKACAVRRLARGCCKVGARVGGVARCVPRWVAIGGAENRLQDACRGAMPMHNFLDFQLHHINSTTYNLKCNWWTLVRTALCGRGHGAGHVRSVPPAGGGSRWRLREVEGRGKRSRGSGTLEN